MSNPLAQQLDTALLAYEDALPRQSRLIELAGQVLQELAAVQANLPAASGTAASETGARLKAGEPLLVRLPIPEPTFQQILKRLLALCQRFELLPPLSDELIRSLLALPPPTWLEGAAKLPINCQGRDLPVGLFFFLGQKALSPFYQRAAAPLLTDFLQGGWEKGSCPGCGRSPALASLAPDSGQRLLYCSLCAAQWPFPGQTCPFCGKQGALFSYVFAENDPARRADRCPACRSYLKTIVTSRLTYPLYLPLEEFVTIDLDILMASDDLLTE